MKNIMEKELENLLKEYNGQKTKNTCLVRRS